MLGILKFIEKREMDKDAKKIPAFKAGDTLRVHTRVVEGKNERIQVFEGVCIARRNDGVNSSFSVYKQSFGSGVEKVFPLYAPVVAKIEIAKHGRVRRSKLYYLKSLFGKKARIAEDLAAAAKARAAAKADAADAGLSGSASGSDASGLGEAPAKGGKGSKAA
jgi:large subunit ribosomal protein L19